MAKSLFRVDAVAVERRGDDKDGIEECWEEGENSSSMGIWSRFWLGVRRRRVFVGILQVAGRWRKKEKGKVWRGREERGEGVQQLCLLLPFRKKERKKEEKRAGERKDALHPV
jgi:hypothetical protein